ncbi:MAG: hypothetical protein IPO21_01590 [Bacteroidales bacterium]|nr:hypothetical protein [Bacteroidales bacterium]
MINNNIFTSNRLVRNLILLLAFVLFTSVEAQYFGEKIYSFVNVPNSARRAALGENVSLSNEELCFAFQNPSLLDSVHEHKIYATWAPIANAGLNINLGAIGYAFRKTT